MMMMQQQGRRKRTTRTTGGRMRTRAFERRLRLKMKMRQHQRRRARQRRHKATESQAMARQQGQMKRTSVSGASAASSSSAFTRSAQFARLASSVVEISLEPVLMQRWRPIFQPSGPQNSSRYMGASLKNCERTQVHMRATGLGPTTGSAGARALPSMQFAPDATSLENAQALNWAQSLTPKTKLVRGIDCAKAQFGPVYLLTRRRIAQRTLSEINRNKKELVSKPLRLKTSSPVSVASNVARESGPTSDGRAEERPECWQVGLNCQLSCKKLLKRQQVVSTSRAKLFVGGRQLREHTASSLLRPPVQRLKSMPPSNQRATHTNNSNNNSDRQATNQRRQAHCQPAARGVSSLGIGLGGMIRPIRAAHRSGVGNSVPLAAAARGGIGLASSTYSAHQRLVDDMDLVQLSRASNSILKRTETTSRSNSSNSQFKPQDQINEMELIKATSMRTHQWHWSETEKSHECIVSDDRLSLCFHPHCSESSAACRASEPIKRNGNYYYWEILVQDKIYGTSVMFGLCTKRQRMHANDYCNVIGLDDCGWSLSHKGLIWHNGMGTQYTGMFPMNQPITIGLLFDTMRGELSYFRDGRSLGVAFKGLNSVREDLYPVVASTAKCTQMTLIGTYCGFVSLLERSCFSLLRSARDLDGLIEHLRGQNLPKHLFEYVAQAANVGQDKEKGAKVDPAQLQPESTPK